MKNINSNKLSYINPKVFIVNKKNFSYKIKTEKNFNSAVKKVRYFKEIIMFEIIQESIIHFPKCFIF